MDALTAALVDHLWVRSLLLWLAGVGLLTVILSLHAGAGSFWEHWRFWKLRGAVDTLRKELRGGRAGGAAQDQLADLSGLLYQLGVLDQESLPALGNVLHLRTALAALDDYMRRWALDQARNTNWKSNYAPEETT